MNLRYLSNKILLENLISLVKKERELTLQVLHHLREIERRSLFSELGYSSLFEYVVRELKYSESAAQRRISSMRLLRELPELETKIEEGVLTLSHLSQAQSFFRQEKVGTIDEKREILFHLENKSKREVERELISRSTEPAKLVVEKIRQITPKYSEIKILVEEKILKQIEEIKNLLAHAKPSATTREVIEHALSETLERLKPKAPKENKTVQPIKSLSLLPPAAVGKSTRYISQNVKREVWARDKGQCTYVNKDTKKRCMCKYGLEFDHIKAFALGGDNSTENLRLKCRAHNQLAAIQVFGKQKMQTFVPRLR
jgi:hypothetical protein